MKDPYLLLVEDNPDDELLIRRAIEKVVVRRELVVAHDGEEGLRLLTSKRLEQGRLPLFILLDLKLPKLNGIEVLRRIRSEEQTRLVPVVMFSSSSEEKEIQECYRSGANSYVRKPGDFARFNESLQLICGYWLGANENPYPLGS
ncbi:MAG TPA: response regulator [Geobacterales bacterium]|nr:response regulator [Geobacterales bacterium]